MLKSNKNLEPVSQWVPNLRNRGKGNLIRYMLNVINYETPNADTISAIKEVEELKKNPNKKNYASFRELLEDITNE